MFRTILLPLDLTDKHQRALDTAVDLARQHGGELVLLHVVELIPGLPREEDREFYDRLERAAADHLARAAQALSKAGIRSRTKILFGPRAVEVARYAAEITADLIVVTVPPLDPSHPAAGWASLSWKVGVLAPCPVLLVK